MDNTKRVGDINLLIYSQQPSFELARKVTREFFKICEGKIDVLVINPRKMTQEQELPVQSINKIPLTNL